MEYTKELVEKIIDKMHEQHPEAPLKYWDMATKALKFFLPVELPPCPVCDGIIKIDMNQVDTNEQWYWFCSRKPCDVGSMDVYDTKQDAIDAYLDTPYCKLYLKDKQ